MGLVVDTVTTVTAAAHSFSGKDEGHGDIDVDFAILLPFSIQAIFFSINYKRAHFARKACD